MSTAFDTCIVLMQSLYQAFPDSTLYKTHLTGRDSSDESVLDTIKNDRSASTVVTDVHIPLYTSSHTGIDCFVLFNFIFF